MSAAVSLAYVATMQEHGIPVTFAYISTRTTSTTRRPPTGPAAGLRAAARELRRGVRGLLTRLAHDGITQSNTLFVFTVDEGDHFVGVAPSPSTCDGGSGNYCSYPAPGDAGTGLGEINVNVDLLLSSEQPALASNFVMGNRTNPSAPLDFTVHGDDAPTFYLSRVVAGDAGQATGQLPQTDTFTRQFEQAAATFTEVNPYTGNTDNLLYQMADQAGMQALHMYEPFDTARNPTFVYFANDNYYLTDYPRAPAPTAPFRPTPGNTATTRASSARPGSASSAPAWSARPTGRIRRSGPITPTCARRCSPSSA